MLVAVLLILIIGFIVLLGFSWAIFYDVDRFQESNSKLLTESTELTTSLATQTMEMSGFIIDSQEVLDRKLDAVVRVVDQHSTFVNEQMRIIQSLANSDIRAARWDELVRTKELKIALEQIVALTSLSRQQPDSRYITSIEYTTNRIEELETILGGGEKLVERT